MLCWKVVQHHWKTYKFTTMIDLHNSFTDARRLPTTHEYGLDVKRHEIQGHHPCIEFRDQTFGNMRKLSIVMHRKERLLWSAYS